MEPAHDGPTAPNASPELVLQNGRLSGARRVLNPHVTLVGQAAGCDVRLDVKGVNPLHCLLVQTPVGLVLRDLQSETGTQVNGEAVTERPLHDGDVVSVGPFRFKIRVPALDVRPDPEALEREKDAFRIQVAAVAAQQAALIEEEIRLRQRRVALEQQEAQLAAHLEEKRRRLTDLRDQARQARSDLQSERAAYEQRVAATAQELAVARREIAAGQQLVQTERRRLVDLRNRLKQRWHRHWLAERLALRRREEEVAAARRDLEKKRERLQRRKEALHQDRLRHNGETELAGRSLQAAWQQLERERGTWYRECEARQADFDEQARRLREREIALAAAERILALDGRRWRERRRALEAECQGLESRIGNQRRKLLEREREAERLDTAVHAPADRNLAAIPALPPPPPPKVLEVSVPDGALRQAEEHVHERTAALERLAGDLADQRLHLVEQCHRLVQAQEEWQHERAAAAEQLEAIGLRLQERERLFASRELALHALECGVRQRQDELALRRRSLEAWQTRLGVQTTAWEAARDRLLAEVQAREELCDRRLTVLTDLRRRWHSSRRKQLDRVRAEREACERLGLEYVALREEVLSRRAVLEQEYRTVGEWAMALAEYRQECLEQVADAPALARHLEEIHRRCAAVASAGERGLEAERRVLQAEAARHQERQRELDRLAERTTLRETELAERQAAWQQQQVLAEDERCKIKQELHRLRLERDRQEQALQELRAELERVVGVLLEDGRALLPLDRAA